MSVLFSCLDFKQKPQENYVNYCCHSVLFEQNINSTSNKEEILQEDKPQVCLISKNFRIKLGISKLIH